MGGHFGIGTTGPNGGLHVATNGDNSTGLGALMNGGLGGGSASMELRGGTPYIDFSNGGSEDFDIRFIRDSDYRLHLQGGQLYISNHYINDFFEDDHIIFTHDTDFLGNSIPSFLEGTNPVTTLDCSIYTIRNIAAPAFIAYSDRRIKKDFRMANNQESLQKINQLKVQHYRHIDIVQEGPQERMGFIAQEVEEIFPEAVNQLEKFIPNIYKMADEQRYDANASTLTIQVETDVELKVGDKVRFMIKGEEAVRELIIDAVNGNSFTIENWTDEVEQIFVYGTEVKDFKTVDYDRIFILGVSAIQELDDKVQRLEKELEEMENIKIRLSEMEKAIQSLQAGM